MTAPLARFVKRGHGPEDRRMICAARNAAGGRSRSAAERVGRERSEGGADGRCLPTQRGVCAAGARSRWEAQSPAAEPHQEGVTETSVSVEMGASKTVPPASIREETSSLQRAQTEHECTVGYLPSNRSARLNPRGRDKIFVVILTPVSDQMHIRDSVPCD